MSSYGYVLPTPTIYEDESGYEYEGKDAEDDKPEMYVELSAVEGKGSTTSELSRSDWSSRPLPDIPTPEHERSMPSGCQIVFKSVFRVIFIVIVTFSIVCVVVANYQMFFVLPRVPSNVTSSMFSSSTTENNNIVKTTLVSTGHTEFLPTSLVTLTISLPASNSSSTSIETSVPSNSSEPSPPSPVTVLSLPTTTNPSPVTVLSTPATTNPPSVTVLSTPTTTNPPPVTVLSTPITTNPSTTSVEISTTLNSSEIPPTPPVEVPTPNFPVKTESQFISVSEMTISPATNAHALTSITNTSTSSPSDTSEVRPTPSVVVPSPPPPKKATLPKITLKH